MEKTYELVIIGGGPSGVSAGVYAGRKLIKTLFITSDFGGQSNVSDNIQNWIGEKSIHGMTLAKKFEEHLNEYKDENLEILKNTFVENVEKENNLFIVKTKSGQNIKTKSVLVATGSIRRKLPAINADKLEHKGLTYCASCDGLFFVGKSVAVVGAGNAALESALQLAAYCPLVKIFVRSENIKGDELSFNAVAKTPNIQVIYNTEISEIVGGEKVEGIKIKNNKTSEITEEKIDGIFVEIGQIPNTDYVKNLVERDDFGRIKIDPWTCKTNIDGIWAAGDCTNIKYHQNNIASGEGVKALEDIYQWLKHIS